jgi:enoyl-CoA hydratase
MDYKYFLVSVPDAVALVKFNRPPVNALNTELVKELHEVIEALDKDPAVRVIVLTGEGKAFVAGADIGEMSRLSPLEARAFAQNGHKTLARLEKTEKPIICAINGFALGGGCEVALACDIRVMAEGAKIGQPEVSLGIIPGFGGTQRLSRLVGPGSAKELVYTGDHIDAQEALRIGLVNKVVGLDKLMDTVMEMARRIAARGPAAMRLAKSVINRGLDSNLNTGNALEIEAFGVCFASGEPKEGMTAFLEKRKPNWAKNSE